MVFLSLVYIYATGVLINPDVALIQRNVFSCIVTGKTLAENAKLFPSLAEGQVKWLTLLFLFFLKVSKSYVVKFVFMLSVWD